LNFNLKLVEGDVIMKPSWQLEVKMKAKNNSFETGK
jgi:hypothetical protein